jgi:hypothetical protein
MSVFKDNVPHVLSGKEREATFEEFNDIATSVFLRDLEENQPAQSSEPSSGPAPAAQLEQLEDREPISSYVILLLIVLAFQEKLENNIAALSHKVEGMNHSLERIHDKLINMKWFFSYVL